MTWNKNDYPESMKDLDDKVRNKAIEIANELLDENYSEDKAIPIAINKAKEWAENHVSGSKIHHIVPNGDNWEIKKENSKNASYKFDTKKQALDKAREMLKNETKSVIVHKKDGTIEDALTN
ncbi:DUF2188 domain-containing protein [Senegalia massiliensis]|uniref:DUF2188 domain-containing protein n=1 Tax=Senegalia massiliensis TaxID=1720316 RepID=UPI001030640B|nr:DUF2188 domain-containing protein [Senegalia massiliensis]